MFLGPPLALIFLADIPFPRRHSLILRTSSLIFLNPPCHDTAKVSEKSSKGDTAGFSSDSSGSGSQQSKDSPAAKPSREPRQRATPKAKRTGRGKGQTVREADDPLAFHWGRFLISPIRAAKDAPITAWGATCGLHWGLQDGNKSKTACKIWMQKTCRGVTSSDEACILQMKRWLLVGLHLTPDISDNRWQHVHVFKPRPLGPALGEDAAEPPDVPAEYDEQSSDG